MSGQLESHHFFRIGDVVLAHDGRSGIVADSGSLFAIVRWSDGEEREVEQFDPSITVLERAAAGG